jgi:hypothetical protein
MRKEILISDLVFPGSIKIYRHIYNQLEKIMQEMNDRDLSNDIILDHLESIKGHYRKGYYTQHEAHEEQIRYFRKALIPAYERAKFKSLFKKRGAPLKDFALTFLIYALCFDSTPMSRIIRKARWSVVAEYLHEEKIATMEAGTVKKVYQRVNIYKMIEALKLCEEILERRDPSLLPYMPPTLLPPALLPKRRPITYIPGLISFILDQLTPGPQVFTKAEAKNDEITAPTIL